jgi:hypothetical protein
LVRPWIDQGSRSRLLYCLLLIFVGAGSFGAALGCWRSGWQAVYAGLKLPLVFLLTTLGNTALNGMLAPLLGLDLKFRQCFMAILLTFTVASVVLGAFAPLGGFVVWNTPPLSQSTQLTSPEYGFLQLCQVTLIAAAGITGNVYLLPFLREQSANRSVARNVLLAWLAGNLLLGSQICWVLRPFIWDPARPVEFIGPEALRGSFYETVLSALRQLIF